MLGHAVYSVGHSALLQFVQTLITGLDPYLKALTPNFSFLSASIIQKNYKLKP